jgi:hypothetical protein
VGGAVAAWHEGYGIALRSRTWQGLVETGDAYLQIAEAGSFRASAKPMARQIYLKCADSREGAALVEGALRVATAFDALGDREVVDHCVKVAEGVACRQRDGAAMEQVAAARSRFAQHMIRPRAARP